MVFFAAFSGGLYVEAGYLWAFLISRRAPWATVAKAPARVGRKA